MQTDPKMYVVPVKNQQRKRKMLDDTDAKKCKSARASLIETPTRRGISGNLSNDSQNDCSPESESIGIHATIGSEACSEDGSKSTETIYPGTMHNRSDVH